MHYRSDNLNMDAIRIDEHTWSIEDGFVRCFLIEGKNKALLVDSGFSGENPITIAERLTQLPLELINTHADADHIAGNRYFPYAIMHPAEAANYYNIGNGTGKIIPVEDRDIIDLGERKLDVVLIPGHTPGSIALLDCSNGMLFSGDSVQNGNIHMFGPMRDMHAYILSLMKLEGYIKHINKVYPAHGTIPLDRSFIHELRIKAEECLEGRLSKENITLPDGRTPTKCDAIIAGFLI